MLYSIQSIHFSIPKEYLYHHEKKIVTFTAATVACREGKKQSLFRNLQKMLSFLPFVKSRVNKRVEAADQGSEQLTSCSSFQRCRDRQNVMC
jgi:hypothetical protein